MNELMSESASSAAEPHAFSTRAHSAGPLRIVEMFGDLDLTSRDEALDACSSAEHLDVLVDLSHLVFMDCAGYGALVAATSILEHRGGSLAVTNSVGEPRRLIALLEASPGASSES